MSAEHGPEPAPGPDDFHDDVGALACRVHRLAIDDDDLAPADGLTGVVQRYGPLEPLMRRAHHVEIQIEEVDDLGRRDLAGLVLDLAEDLIVIGRRGNWIQVIAKRRQIPAVLAIRRIERERNTGTTGSHVLDDDVRVFGNVLTQEIHAQRDGVAPSYWYLLDVHPHRTALKVALGDGKPVHRVVFVPEILGLLAAALEVVVVRVDVATVAVGIVFVGQVESLIVVDLDNAIELVIGGVSPLIGTDGPVDRRLSVALERPIAIGVVLLIGQ